MFKRLLLLGLLGATAAQLHVRPPLSVVKYDSSKYLENLHSAQQAPLINPHLDQPTSDLPPFKAGKFTLTSQNNTTCATHGESQWTGTIDVTDAHRLFFWFFDSRGDPENDPIIIWINGGPGGSSMMGLFSEMGPCWLEPGANETTPNEYAWNANASLLFIDQPAGVGFSSRKDGEPVQAADLDGAQDFQVFLNTFFGEIFPDRAHLPIHFAGESYGGHYAPTYVNHILKSRAYDSKFAFWGNISSLILVNALIDFTAPMVGAYELMCSDFRGGNIVNHTACESIRLSLPECERLGRSCDLSNDGYECWAMMSFCRDKIDEFYWEQVDAGLRNPYNIHLGCNEPPLCEDPHKGNFSRYLNQPHIKEALQFPPSFTFSPIDFVLNTAYTDGRTPFKPTTGELGAILDAYLTPGLGDIKLLVLQGNEDYVVNTPGQVWAYNNLRWSGQADYRIEAWRELEEDVNATGFWKGTADRRLLFVGLDGAGHTVPGDVREGSLQVIQKWIK